MLKNKSKLIIYLVLVFVVVIAFTVIFFSRASHTLAACNPPCPSGQSCWAGIMCADDSPTTTTEVADTVAKTSTTYSVDSQGNRTTTDATTYDNGTTISMSVTENKNGDTINQGISVVQWVDTSGNDTAYSPDANLTQISQSSESAPNSNDETITTTVAVYTSNGDGTGGTLIGSSTQSDQYNQVTAGQPSDSAGGHNYTGEIVIDSAGNMIITENIPYGNTQSTELGGKTQTNTATYRSDGTIVLAASTKNVGGNYDTYGGGAFVTYSYPTISLCEINPTDPKCMPPVNSGTGTSGTKTGTGTGTGTGTNTSADTDNLPFCVANPNDKSCVVTIVPFCAMHPTDPTCLSCTPEDCAGKTCGYNAGCGGTCLSGTCPSGHTCSGGICVCVPNRTGNCGDNGCGVSLGTCTPYHECQSNSCTPLICSASFSVSPTFHTIFLGGHLGVTWSASSYYCRSCVLSCTGNGCSGTELPNYNFSNSNYKITPTNAGSYTYTLTCENPNPSISKQSIVVKVIRLFWSETPAFLKLLIDKFFSK